MIPSQEDIDWNDPKPNEHLAWALQLMPTFAGVGAVTHPGFLTNWSEHLVNAGVVHVDYLKTLADEDGNIHVSKLPIQTIKYQPAFRGPRHGYNGAARWVDHRAEAPKPMRLPDIKQLTIQENEYMIQQYRDSGLITDSEVEAPGAGVIDE